MSHNTQTATKAANVTIDLNGIDWTNVAWPEDSDKSDLRDSSPIADESVISAYFGSNQTEKARIRTNLTNVANAFIRDLRVIEARNVQFTLSACVGQSVRTAEKPDFAQLVANRIATLRMAADRLESGQITPEGMNEDNMGEIDFSDLPDGTADTDNADKIAQTRIFRSRTDETYAIAPIVRDVVESMESGQFMTIAGIRNKARELGLVPPTWNGDGALAAHLFPNGGRREVDGAVVHNIRANGRPRGIAKL